MKEAAKIVSSAILGMDCKSVVVNGKVYVIMPPTIKKIAGAGYYLSDLGKGTITDAILSADFSKIASALSFLIRGDNSLHDELLDGTFDEVSKALLDAYSLISVRDFLKLSDFARSVANLIAKQRQ